MIEVKVRTKKVFNLPFKISGYLIIPFVILSVYTTNLELKRGYADRLYKTARDLIVLEDLDSSIKVFEELLQVSPLYYRAHLMLGASYLKKNDLEKAAHHLELGLTYYPNESLPLFQAGSLYVLKIQNELKKPSPDNIAIVGFEKKAIELYDHALAIKNDYEKPWNNLGFIYEKQYFRFKQEGKLAEAEVAFKKAEESYDKAIKLNAHYFDGIINKASFLIKTSRTEEAVTLLFKVLQISLDKYEQKSKSLELKVAANFKENSNDFININNARVSNRIQFLRIAPKVIEVLKNQLIAQKKYAEFIVVLGYDLKLKLVQLEEEEEYFYFAFQELEFAKKDSKSIKPGLSLLKLEENYRLKKASYEKAKLNTDISIAKILLDKGEVFKIQNKLEEAIEVFYKISGMAESQLIPEQNSLALLKINEIYLNTPGPELSSLFLKIEQNFTKASYVGSPAINDYKKMLVNKFVEIKNNKK